MLSLQQLAECVHLNISKSSVQFQKFISQIQIYQHPQLLKIISDLLNSDLHTIDNKMLAASSRIKFNLQNLQNCWNQYFDLFINQNQANIQWKYLLLTKNALIYLLTEWEIKVVQKVTQRFGHTAFCGKLLLMIAFNQTQDISEDNKYIFIRQTIENFTNQSLCFITEIHQKRQFNLKIFFIQHDIMETLFQCLRTMKMYGRQDFLNILNFLARKNVMCKIVKQELRMVVHRSNNRYQYKMIDNIFSILDDSINGLNYKQAKQILKLQINIKAFALRCLELLASEFLVISELEQFDTYFVLALVESITPILLDQLSKSSLLKEQCLRGQVSSLNSSFKYLLISIFCLLRRSTDFIFLMQIFSEKKPIILHSIFLEYLRTTQQQLQVYENDGDDFLSLNSNFMEKITDQDCDTPKQACGLFLEGFFTLITNSQAQYIDFLCKSLRYHLLSEESELITNAKKQGFEIPPLEIIYLVISRIYVFADKNNQYFMDYVYQNFVQPDYVFSLKKLQKTRFLMFLFYCYGHYFVNDSNQGTKYLRFSLQSKINNPSDFSVNIYLLQTSFDCGIGLQIWDHLMNRLRDTKQIKQLKLIRNLLEKYSLSLDKRRILDLTLRVCQKVRKQFEQNKQNMLCPYEDCTIILYQSFHLLEIIVQNKQLMQRKSQSQIIKELIYLVDYFSVLQIENYKFNAQIVKILNCIIEKQQSIPIQFQQYLGFLQRIICKQKQYGHIIQTYYLILFKSSETFQSSPSFINSILGSIQEKVLNPAIRNTKLLVQAFFLLQNIYLVYPHLIKQNRNLFKISVQLFQNQKNNEIQPDAKLIASILLFWMSGQYAFGDYNLAALSQCKIQIFTEEFGLMFALNLRKLIQKYYDTQSLEYLLKLALKLLDFQHFYKNKTTYKGPKFCLSVFEKYLSLDSFEQINCAIQFLKQKLPRQKFIQYAQMLKQQIGGNAANQLLNIRMIGNKKERNVVAVKRI